MRVLDGRIDFFHVHTDLGRYFDGDVDHHLQGLTHPIAHVTEILPLVAAVHRFKGEHSLGTYFHILEILNNLHKLAFACKYVIINHDNLSRRLLKFSSYPFPSSMLSLAKGIHLRCKAIQLSVRVSLRRWRAFPAKMEALKRVGKERVLSV